MGGDNAGTLLYEDIDRKVVRRSTLMWLRIAPVHDGGGRTLDHSSSASAAHETTRDGFIVLLTRASDAEDRSRTAFAVPSGS